jgi:monoamine oxidase
MYDVIIVGGGMAGLYTAYKLPKELKILVLEKYSLGGKVDTHVDKVMTVEKGAARFSKHHVLLMELLHELGLASKIKPIPYGNPSFVSVTGAESFPLRNLWDKLKKSRKPKSSNILFGEYIQDILTTEEYEFFKGAFGYSSEFEIMNAADAFRAAEQYTHHFNVLQGGLSQMVHRLVARLGHVDFIKEGVKDVRYINGQFVVSGAEKVYRGAVCVLAMPKVAVEKFWICKPLKAKLAYVKTSPLCRIYAQCPNGMFAKKITTDNDLKFVIPVAKNVVLASYTDGAYAERWKQKNELGVREVSKNLTELYAELGLEITMKHVKVFYWPDGVGYWGLGANSAQLERELLHPYQEVPFYLCGENYSHEHQQWMEGALNTAAKVVDIMRKDRFF